MNKTDKSTTQHSLPEASVPQKRNVVFGIAKSVSLLGLAAWFAHDTRLVKSVKVGNVELSDPKVLAILGATLTGYKAVKDINANKKIDSFVEKLNQDKAQASAQSPVGA